MLNLRKTGQKTYQVFIRFVIKALYMLFWIIGLIIFSILIIVIITSKDKIDFIAPLAILISAFLASTSVQLSILNTKNMEEKRKEDEKIKVYLQIQYIFNALNNEMKSYSSICKNANKFCIEDKCDNLKKFDFKEQLNLHNNIFLNRLISLENINLLLIDNKFLESITKICISLSRLNMLNSVLRNYEEINKKRWIKFFNQVEEIIFLIKKEEGKVRKLLSSELSKEQQLNIPFYDNDKNRFYDKV